MNKHLGRRSGRATPSSPPHLASTPTSIYNEIKVFYSRVGNCTVSYVDSYQVQKTCSRINYFRFVEPRVFFLRGRRFHVFVDVPKSTVDQKPELTNLTHHTRCKQNDEIPPRRLCGSDPMLLSVTTITTTSAFAPSLSSSSAIIRPSSSSASSRSDTDVRVSPLRTTQRPAFGLTLSSSSLSLQQQRITF